MIYDHFAIGLPDGDEWVEVGKTITSLDEIKSIIEIRNILNMI